MGEEGKSKILVIGGTGYIGKFIEEGKSKILVIGGTGYIGKFIVRASTRSGHPTFVLVRDAAAAASDPFRAKILDEFKAAGVTLVHGDLFDHESLVKAIKGVDVVISAVGYAQIPEQTRIIAAIKEAGNIKRFFPSEFANDVDRVDGVEPAKTLFATMAKIRRAIEAEGIPYTYVSSNFFAHYVLPSLGPAGATGTPTDKIDILGDGDQKVIFVNEEDIGTYTIKAADDPRTLNKTLYLRPPGDIYSHNELVSLWEKKIGKTLERVYVPEEEVLKQIQEASVPLNVVSSTSHSAFVKEDPVPLNLILSICHSAFVKGDHTNFEIDPSFGVEASELYPDVKYTCVDEILNEFV